MSTGTAVPELAGITTACHKGIAMQITNSQYNENVHQKEQVASKLN